MACTKILVVMLVVITEKVAYTINSKIETVLLEILLYSCKFYYFGTSYNHMKVFINIPILIPHFIHILMKWKIVIIILLSKAIY